MNFGNLPSSDQSRRPVRVRRRGSKATGRQGTESPRHKGTSGPVGSRELQGVLLINDWPAHLTLCICALSTLLPVQHPQTPTTHWHHSASYSHHPALWCLPCARCSFHTVSCPTAPCFSPTAHPTRRFTSVRCCILPAEAGVASQLCAQNVFIRG
jgi:hypothetical protein